MDLGYGPGHVTGWLAERGVRAVGIDLSPAMIAIAQREYPGAEFREATSCICPLRTASSARRSRATRSSILTATNRRPVGDTYLSAVARSPAGPPPRAYLGRVMGSSLGRGAVAWSVPRRQAYRVPSSV
ncbi:class I SAM-dependent methyltransferase [Embleya sp. AB8]|uniref:class I SAM-dependent methyltransferase n=1 Tax=Embleya sp. AB8 TaxID=3156304 RepID=UPI003C76E912